MLKYQKILINLVILISLLPLSCSQDKMSNPEANQNWDSLSNETKQMFLTKISDAQEIVDKGKSKAAKREYTAIKKGFSDFLGPDIDLFIEAEIFLANRSFSDAARKYDNMLTNYRSSILADKAINREYEIGMSFLKGRKKIVIGFIPISGYDEGIEILEKMIDHAGINKQISIDASIAIAKNYEKREKFNEAYLKWWEIYSLVKKNETVNRDALLEMAKMKFAVYNKNPEPKQAYYDASCLQTAQTYYEMFKTSYPEYAEEIGVNETLNVIKEELAHKELTIGLFYQRTGFIQSANLYFDMVINNWPETKSAETARNMLKKNIGS